MKRSKASFNIAYSAITCALALIVLFAAVIPSLIYIAPAFAGFVIWSVRARTSAKHALLAFAATSILAAFLVPEIEGKIYFMFFFGYYPILREAIHRIKSKLAQFAIKFAVFNAAAVSSFWLVVYVFGIADVLGELTWGGEYALYVFWGMGNLAFVLYDFSLKQYFHAYEKWVVPVIDKKLSK